MQPSTFLYIALLILLTICASSTSCQKEERNADLPLIDLSSPDRALRAFSFAWVIGNEDQLLACCTDGFGPVVWKDRQRKAPIRWPWPADLQDPKGLQERMDSFEVVILDETPTEVVCRLKIYVGGELAPTSTFVLVRQEEQWLIDGTRD